jgi:hypothetical protein
MATSSGVAILRHANCIERLKPPSLRCSITERCGSFAASLNEKFIEYDRH